VDGLDDRQNSKTIYPVTTRFETETNNTGISWWVLLVELFLLVGAGLAIGVLIFSLLPLSVALLVLIIALLTFPFTRTRFESWQHIAAVLLSWVLLSITLLVLIGVFGRESFNWLLDWN